MSNVRRFLAVGGAGSALLGLMTTIGVMTLWLVVAYSNCEPIPLD
jgi:hypothetical protein